MRRTSSRHFSRLRDGLDAFDSCLRTFASSEKSGDLLLRKGLVNAIARQQKAIMVVQWLSDEIKPKCGFKAERA